MKKRLELEYDKTVKFAFGLGFIGEFIDKSKIGLLELQDELENNPFKTVPLMMYYSRKWAAESDGIEVDFTLNSTIDMIDNDGGITSKNTLKFLDAFAKSMTQDVPKEKESKKGGKPKN